MASAVAADVGLRAEDSKCLANSRLRYLICRGALRGHPSWRNDPRKHTKSHEENDTIRLAERWSTHNKGTAWARKA